SSPPNLCSMIGPEISGPKNDVSSKSFDQVKAVSKPNPLLKRCSTFTSIASYWFFPQGFEALFTPPHSGMGRTRSKKLRLLLVYRPRATAGIPFSCSPLKGFGLSSSAKNLSFGLQLFSCKQFGWLRK